MNAYLATVSLVQQTIPIANNYQIYILYRKYSSIYITVCGWVGARYD